eukprot:364491-Chlamydomonas_euryale.AAC.11
MADGGKGAAWKHVDWDEGYGKGLGFRVQRGDQTDTVDASIQTLLMNRPYKPLMRPYTPRRCQYGTCSLKAPTACSRGVSTAVACCQGALRLEATTPTRPTHLPYPPPFARHSPTVSCGDRSICAASAALITRSSRVAAPKLTTCGVRGNLRRPALPGNAAART